MLVSYLLYFMMRVVFCFSEFQLLFFIFFILFIWDKLLCNFYEEVVISGNVSFIFDILRFILIYMRLIIIIFVLILTLKIKKINYILLFCVIIFSLFFCFLVNRYLIFFILFEFSLIPLVGLIFWQGGRIERFKATMYMVFYTLLGSLILLLIILNMKINLFMGNNFYYYFLKITGKVWILCLLVFLVKMPMYGVHLWLPKAHVEASVRGSMLLAGIVLKLGGFGLIRLFLFLNLYEIRMWLDLIFVVSMVGAILVGFICLRQVDLKIIIAYSSVRHISLLLGSLFRFYKLGIVGGGGLIVAHGFCSRGLFYIGNVFYERSKRRNLNLLKGFIVVYPLFTMFWLLFCLVNAGCPPFYNFFCEILIVFSLLKKRGFLIIGVVIILMLSVFYRVGLFLRVGHGEVWKINFIEQEENLEILVVFMHFLYLIVFWGKFNLYLGI